MRIHKQKVYRNVRISKSLLTDLQDIAHSKIMLNKCLYLIYLVGFHRFKDNANNFFEFKALPTNYLLKAFGVKYFEVTNLLKQNDIIQCDEVMHKNKAFHYRLNPYYSIEGETVNAKFSYTLKSPSTKKYESDKINKEKFISYFNKLSIPYPALYNKIDEIVNGLCIDDFINNYEVDYENNKEVKIVDDYDRIKKIFMTRDEAINTAALEGKMLVQEKQSIYLIDKEMFLEDKKKFVRESYLMAVENLKDDSTLYASRNETNNRLDTNFTNMAKELLKIIYDENGIIEADLKNSQPTLLADILKKKAIQGADVDKFIELCEQGAFYEYWAEKLSIGRKRAKQIMFEVLFASNRLNTKSKRLFKSQFPNVWDFIADYKKTNGKKSFSVLLQALESNIFIDNVYENLTNQGIRCFTKHDSIAFYKDDLEDVENEINRTFEKFDFKGNIDIKNKMINQNNKVA